MLVNCTYQVNQGDPKCCFDDRCCYSAESLSFKWPKRVLGECRQCYHDDYCCPERYCCVQDTTMTTVYRVVGYGLLFVIVAAWIYIYRCRCTLGRKKKMVERKHKTQRTVYRDG